MHVDLHDAVGGRQAPKCSKADFDRPWRLRFRFEAPFLEAHLSPCQPPMPKTPPNRPGQSCPPGTMVPNRAKIEASVVPAVVPGRSLLEPTPRKPQKTNRDPVAQ